MPSSFSALPPAWSDPLFSIAAEAKQAGPTAIDGTVGIVLTEDGLPHALSVVRKAAMDLAAASGSRHFSYPPLLGVPEFRKDVLQLLEIPDAASMSTAGGTAALALAVRTSRVMLGDRVEILLPTPTWINHHNICHGAGIRTLDVPVFENGRCSEQKLLDTLDGSDKPRALLVQAGCHNPTGLDLSEDSWKSLATLAARHSIIVILDIAYQGFSASPAEDIGPLRILRAAGVTTLVAWSASKNHSIYGLRTGLVAASTASEEEKKRAEGQFMQHARTFTSAAPVTGQEIVHHVQSRYLEEWQRELAELRSLFQKKREMLSVKLPMFSDALRGHGMFALLPLTSDQIRILREEYRVFLAPDGRINIAGLALQRMEELIEAMKKVTSTQA
ncbi:MAG: aminotransferase class I/II-fold pyridoxal phosphate-dependent enzyme [Candidatus Peribacteraceae bacterium]